MRRPTRGGNFIVPFLRGLALSIGLCAAGCFEPAQVKPHDFSQVVIHSDNTDDCPKELLKGPPFNFKCHGRDADNVPQFLEKQSYAGSLKCLEKIMKDRLPSYKSITCFVYEEDNYVPYVAPPEDPNKVTEEPEKSPE